MGGTFSVKTSEMPLEENMFVLQIVWCVLNLGYLFAVQNAVYGLLVYSEV